MRMPQLKFPKSGQYNFAFNLVKRYKLVPHLDKYLGTEVDNFQFTYEPKTDDDAWHPSGSCTPSPTDLYESAVSYLDGTAVKKDWGVTMLKTFMVGHFWHQLLQKAVLDLGFAEPDAIERIGKRGWAWEDPNRYTPKPYHWATGQGDVAPCSVPGYGDYVVDFKTMSAHQYKTEGLPDWAAAKYEAQINIYMDFFDLDKGLIVAICKDTPHEFKEFEFERNQDLIDAVYNKWEFVSECLDEGIAPQLIDNEMFKLPIRGPIAQ